MQDDVSDIRDFYNRSAPGEDGRLQRHQLERDITMRYLDEYLVAGARVLEIGAATGAYTVPLAHRGHHVTAVDLAEDLLGHCRERAATAGVASRVTFVVADARDLSAVPEGSFDAVLLMGPLYHLVEEGDRLLALAQACAQLKPRGLLFSALISRFGILGHLLKKVPHWIENQPEVRSVIERGRDPEATPKGGFRGYYCKLSEVQGLHESAGFQTLLLAGVEPAISADDESYNRLEGEQRDLWLDLLYHISTEASRVASSRHLLYIGQKPDCVETPRSIDSL